MADLHSTPDTDETGTERTLIVGYRPHGLDKSTPCINLSGKWLRAAGFDGESHERLHRVDGV